MSHYLPTSLSLYILTTYTSVFGFLLLILIACFILYWIIIRSKGNKNQLNNTFMMALHVSSTLKLARIGMIALSLQILEMATFIWYGWMYVQDKYQMVYWSGSIALVILDYLFQVCFTLFVLELVFEGIRKACKVSVMKYHGKWFSFFVSVLVFLGVFGCCFGYLVTPLIFIMHLFCNFVSVNIVETAHWSTNLSHVLILGICSIFLLVLSSRMKNEYKHVVDHVDVDFNETEEQVSLKTRQAARLLSVMAVMVLVYCVVFLMQNVFLEIPQIYVRELSVLGSNTISDNLHLWFNVLPQLYIPVMFVMCGLCIGRFNSIQDPNMYINQ
ncbi:hypothetical protein C9374_010730 [Naegleria lovaniensis]|uniref:Uncharacterized protein n=1 Tax=Naegleria lovaniensis TaxID=51637 RepID=A0AA88GHX3_NAELO|nr:uncharacterized protein C9374_010730 [Naegleria lovaniensis]KAG2374446.1 hypothetical protein C9374_010730 [Naegleria lovaniensis]